MPVEPSRGEGFGVCRSVCRYLVEASDTDESVGCFDESSDIGGCDPLPADGRQVLVGRLTGDGTCLSDVDRHFVLTRLGKQVADRWHADAFQGVAHA
jgi:hypothetical protein